MKAALKLITSERTTKNGFPIYITLQHLKQRSKKCVGYSVLKFWNIDTQLPLALHPDHNNLLPAILEYKAKISKINIGNYTFNQARLLLFGEQNATGFIFYTAGLTLCDNTSNGKLYKTVLNSFNKVFPGVAINDITQDHAIRYMRQLLTTTIDTTNGVHTYMRTLNAIFNKLSTSPNPFIGVRPKKTKPAKKALTDIDLKKMINTRTVPHKFDGKNTPETINYYRYYWLLLFYLGGIDCIDLARLRYDKHVVDGRIQFNRNKGGTNVFINNKILPKAQQLLDKFNCFPYLVPIYKYKVHNDFVSNMDNRFPLLLADLELTKRPLTKSARHTFSNRAQQLLIDERITIEIVGHTQQKTHSIYTDEFPLKVRDAAHKKIININ